MRLLLNKASALLTFFMATPTFANEKIYVVPECPRLITVKNGIVIDSDGWDYSFYSNFINKDTKKVTMKDGVLISDYKFPEVSKINSATNSLTGGLSYDVIDESDNFLSLTWDIGLIYKTSIAVYICDFHGDRKSERPVRGVYLYKKIPKKFKMYTVSYDLIEYERVPESQKFICK